MGFRDLHRKQLNQKVMIMRNWIERIRIEKALNYSFYYESTSYLTEIDGLEFMEQNLRTNCLTYILGENFEVEDLVPNVLEHDGTPKEGDLIIYGLKLTMPQHIGVWQEDGTVISQWGDSGLVMKHKWNQIPHGYGNRAFFSKYPLQ